MPIQAAYIGIDKKTSEEVNDLISKSFKEILVIAIMDNPADHMDLIYHLNLDLVIMDIDVDPKGKEDIIHLIPEKFADKTVIISEHEHKAIEAMHCGILDFLPKPVDLASIKQIINHFKHHLEHEHHAASMVNFDRIIVNRHDKAYLLELDSILYFTADGPYTNINITGDKRISSSKPLGYYRDLLMGKNNFVAINRSIILNIQNIKEIVKDDGEGTLIMKDGSRFEVSRASKNRLMQILYELQGNNL